MADAPSADQILGKVATQAACLLMGKHRPTFTRHLDMGDYVVVINADKLHFTGNKSRQKLYYRHSAYPGGLKSLSLEKMMQLDPSRVVKYAVRGMLPRNRLGDSMLKKLRVYIGNAHPHLAQTKR